MVGLKVAMTVVFMTTQCANHQGSCDPYLVVFGVH